MMTTKKKTAKKAAAKPKPAKKRIPREDLNPAAARVVREVTKNL
jgi:hypothetical protein